MMTTGMIPGTRKHHRCRSVFSRRVASGRRRTRAAATSRFRDGNRLKASELRRAWVLDASGFTDSPMDGVDPTGKSEEVSVQFRVTESSKRLTIRFAHDFF